MLQPPLISIPLDIPDVRVLQTDLTAAGEFILTVETTLTHTICQRCGRPISDQHGVDAPRLLRHLPILGRPVYLRIRPKRFRCPFCEGQPTTTQQPDWYDPKALHTKAYERHLIVQLINSTLTDVTEKEDVSYAALVGVLDRWIATTVDWDTLPPCPTLGLDEIALLKGHRDFVAVITARDSADDLHVVAVLPDRLKSTVVAWLTALPAAVRARITTVCTDMWEGYVTAVEEALPAATIVIDRFHVARHYRAAIDALRWIERQSLAIELRALKSQSIAGEDAWWFAYGTEPARSCRFNDMLDALLDGASPAAVVHASRTEDDPVPWRAIHYRAWWSNPLTSKIWTIAFWTTWAVFGWFLVCLAFPPGGQTAGQLTYFICLIGIIAARRPISMRLATRFPSWARPIRARNSSFQ